MFLLSFNAFGEGIFADSPPNETSYEQLNFYGDIVLDGLNVVDYEISNNDLLNINAEPVFGLGTVLTANFSNTLEAGSILTSIPYPLTAFVIRRKLVGGSLNPILTTINDPNQIEYTDFTPRNNVDYVYTVSPLFSDITNRIEGRGFSTSEEGVSVSFWGYILSSYDGTTQYKFDVAIDSGEVTVNTDFHKYEGYSKYPKFNFIDRQYKESTLSTIPLMCNEQTLEREITTEMIDTLREFVNDKQIKILRTPSGEGYPVVTFGYKYKYFDEIGTQPYRISFSFCQVSDSIV